MVLVESYNVNDDDFFHMHGGPTGWLAQSFTIGNTGANGDYTLTSIKILCYKAGVPGTATISIRADDGTGKPTGSDLSTGTFDANALTTDVAGEWKEVTMSALALNASTMYHIVGTCQGVITANDVRWRIDLSSPAYTGGTALTSTGSGTIWTIQSSGDLMFEVYGDASVSAPAVVSTSLSGSVFRKLKKKKELIKEPVITIYTK